MPENRKIHTREALPDLESRADIQQGYIVPTLCRSVYAGRGLHPRPERSTHARALDECPKTGRFTRGRPCRIWSCRRIFSRGISFQPCAGRCMPVGGCPPDRNDPPTQGHWMDDRKQEDSRKGNLAGFGVAGRYSAGMYRSDLVPVGGCTPDRNDPPTRGHWMNARKQEDSHEGGLAGFGVADGYLAGVDRSGRGFNPRPAYSDRRSTTSINSTPDLHRPAQDRTHSQAPLGKRQKNLLISTDFFKS